MEPAVSGDYVLSYNHIVEQQPFTALFLVLAFLLALYPLLYLARYLFEPERSWLDRIPLPVKIRFPLVSVLTATTLITLALALFPTPINPALVSTVSASSPEVDVRVDTIKDRRDGRVYYGEYGRESVKVADTTPLVKIFPEESLLPATDVVTLIKLNSKTYYFEGYIPTDRLSQMITESEIKRIDGTTTPNVVGYMSDISLGVK